MEHSQNLEGQWDHPILHKAPSKIQPHIEAPAKSFIFEIRTKFKIKRKLDDENNDNNAYDCVMIGSESLSATLPVYQTRDLYQQKLAYIIYCLNEYLMPGDKIQSLVHDALDFAEHLFALDPSVPVVPIVVNVKVCTVQKDGETGHDAMDRLVRPECLVPLDLVRSIQKPCHSRRLLHDFCLFGLERVGGGHDMDACPVCMGGPTDWYPVSRLPSCGHAFHSHCVVRWLLERESCPLCRQEVVAEKVRGLASCNDRCDTQPIRGIGPGPCEEVETPHRPNNRQRQPSSWPGAETGIDTSKDDIFFLFQT